MNKSILKRVALAVLPYVATTIVGVAAEPIANLSERWTTSTEGWAFTPPSTGAAVFTNGALLLKFNARSADSVFSQATDGSQIVGMTNASQGRFSGDYSQMESISFDVCATNISNGALYVGNVAAGRMWVKSFTVPPSASPWATVEVPLAPTGWNYVGFPSASSGFAADLTDVKEIYIEVMRDQTCYAAQSLLVDNMKVVGPWSGPFTNGVSVYWFQECGLVGADVDAFADKDGDGLSNLGEYLAGTIPTDPNSTFKVRIEKNSEGQTVLRWPHAKGRMFGIWKATDLTSQGGFDKVAHSLQDQGTENSQPVSDSGNAAFYRIEIEQ